MKLKTRLFLWVGSLFLLFALVSYFLENFLVRDHLKRSKQEIREEIQKNEEQIRDHLEEFLGDVIADYQAKIDALLYELRARDLTRQSWPFLSNILLENKWIGSIQYINPQGFSSSIIPFPSVLKTFQRQKIDDDLAWIDCEGKIYIGIKIFSKQMQKNLLEFDESLDEYCLYDPKILKALDFEMIQDLNDPQKKFLQRLKKGQVYVRKNDYSKEKFQNRKRVSEKAVPHFSEPTFKEFEKDFTKNVQKRQIIRQIWILNSVLGLDLFGGSIFDLKAPLAIGSLSTKEKSGKALFTRSVMLDEKSLIHPLVQKKGILSSLSLMKMAKQDRFFLGNTLSYGKNDYLSIGIDISDTLQRLSLTANQHTLLIKDQIVLSVYNPKGTHLSNSIFYELKPKYLAKKQGEIILDGKAYYYLRLKPYKNVDFYFCLLDLKKEAFSFVDYVSNAMISLVTKVSISMRVVAIVGLGIVLILLQNIAKKISKPIAQLAKMTEPIAQGHYERVQIPQVPLGPSQEVKTLCHSFSKMVQSLKDKEKVRGVLNKVVSKEIAEEILKGSIHLGGEEKTVTILFADIRDFTKLTEKMSPKEVIELLNLAMTKICQVIDRFKGVVDKFVGDEVMALFGAPMKDDLATLRALIAAHEIMKVLKQLNEDRKKEQKVEIHIGIGIHTGVVVAGNMGAENRLNYTVLGSNVNLAARVCSIAKEDEILITEDTLQAVQEKIKVEKLDPVQLKGFTKKMTPYRLQKILVDLPQERMDA